ncbi:MAG: hypothetical protein M0T74_16150, partial [Desulfitobacterium hafniense]|nr:hypothetical protein [Desulfitobacterium hafniense]
MALSEQEIKLREKYAAETGWKQDVSNWPLRYRKHGLCRAFGEDGSRCCTYAATDSCFSDR